MNTSAIVGGAITCVGGILAASSVLAKMRADAKDMIDKLVPYQGYVGGVMFVWGIWGVISVVMNLGSIGAMGVVSFLFSVITALTDLLVGFLLAFGLISKYTMAGSPAAMDRGQQLRGKLATVQIPLGFLAIIMGILYIVVSVL
jgi:hypothetical protein